MERVESIIEEKEGVRGVLRVGGPVPTNVGRGLSADGSSPFSLDMIPQLTVVHRWELQRWLPVLQHRIGGSRAVCSSFTRSFTLFSLSTSICQSLDEREP